MVAVLYSPSVMPKNYWSTKICAIAPKVVPYDYEPKNPFSAIYTIFVYTYKIYTARTYIM